jgi:hypothetical protein
MTDNNRIFKELEQSKRFIIIPNGLGDFNGTCLDGVKGIMDMFNHLSEMYPADIEIRETDEVIHYIIKDNNSDIVWCIGFW